MEQDLYCVVVDYLLANGYKHAELDSDYFVFPDGETVDKLIPAVADCLEREWEAKSS